MSSGNTSWWIAVFLFLSGAIDWLAKISGIYADFPGFWSFLSDHISAVTEKMSPEFGVMGIGVAILVFHLLPKSARSLMPKQNVVSMPVSHASPVRFAKENQNGEKQPTAVGEELYNILQDFVIDFLEPAVIDQILAQAKMVSESNKIETITRFALLGIYDDGEDSQTYTFKITFKQLTDGIRESPGPLISFQDLTACIAKLESGTYAHFCEQGKRLADILEISLSSNNEYSNLWAQWKRKHISLVQEFEKVKRDSRFGQPLHRPARPSRWGSVD